MCYIFSCVMLENVTKSLWFSFLRIIGNFFLSFCFLLSQTHSPSFCQVHGRLLINKMLLSFHVLQLRESVLVILELFLIFDHQTTSSSLELSLAFVISSEFCTIILSQFYLFSFWVSFLSLLHKELFLYVYWILIFHIVSSAAPLLWLSPIFSFIFQLL